MFDAVNVSAEVVAAILGVSITVVAIVVQLAATRYNHHITEIFIREPLNIAVQAFLVLTTLLCIWVAAMGEGGTSARLNLLTLAMVSVALVILLPYFLDQRSDYGCLHPLLRRIPRRFTEFALDQILLPLFLKDLKRDFVIWDNKMFVDSPKLTCSDGPVARYRKFAGQFLVSSELINLPELE